MPSGASDNIPRVLCSDILADYELWLAGTPLAARTRANYRRWVDELVEDLDAGDELAAFLSPAGEHERRALVTDWRRRLVNRGLAPATVNLALAAATSLLDSRALAAPTVARVQVAAGDARALKAVQLRDLEKAIDALASPRDRAILQVLLRTGLRIGEVAALDRGDVQITQRTGQLVVRHGKGDHYRVVPLSRSARQALNTWLLTRAEHRHATPDVAAAGPLWLSRTGARLSVRSLNAIVAGVMASAGIAETAHALRHTLATRLVRDQGHDLVLVADLLGHRDVKTTARYARSTRDDQRAALEGADAA